MDTSKLISYTRAIGILAGLAVLMCVSLVVGQEPDYDWSMGPLDVSLGKYATLKVPSGWGYLNGEDTQALMESVGNVSSENEVGMVQSEEGEWFILFSFDDIGYVNDDEKKSLDSEAILKTIRKATEAANKDRKEKGFSTMTVIGWRLPPHYNERTHNLEWILNGVDDETSEPVTNCDTRLLGRQGVMNVKLVAAPEELPLALVKMETLLEGFSFKSGSRYEEFVSGDKIAKIGLSALVVGGAAVAAAKSGLLGFLAKFMKVIFFGLIAAAVGLWKWLTGRRNAD